MSYRFAPSNTGFFHIAGIRTAYFNYLMAKADGVDCYLRIDDSDATRSTQAYQDQIMKCLDWVGLDFKFAFKQSDRKDRYLQVANMLLDMGRAVKDGDAIRFKPDANYLNDFNYWTDQISGKITVSNDDKKIIDGMVIVKSDGMPVYHFCSVVDDIDLGITHINRGMDHLSNTARQIALFDLVGNSLGQYTRPMFSHVGLIFKDKKKMSKRDNASSMQGYIDGGYSPDAILNCVLRLGWSPTDANFDRHTPLIPKDLATKIFMTDGKMKSSPANFDLAKLDWYNKKYLSQSK